MADDGPSLRSGNRDDPVTAMSDTPNFGQLGPDDYATEHNASIFVIMQILARFRTVALVQVQTCSNIGGLSPWGTVTATPIISMVNGKGQPQAHGSIFNLPYIRLQGGTSAIILDPSPLDYGLALICDRDISRPKQQPILTGSDFQPATARMANLADGIYLGGCLNGIPLRYIQFDALGNINMTALAAVNIVAPGGLTVNGVPVVVP